MTKKALLFGVYEKTKDKESIVLTKSSAKFDSSISGKLMKNIEIFGQLKHKKCRVFYDLDQKYSAVAVVGLGPDDAGFNEQEGVEEDRENIRAAIAAGVKTLKELGVEEIDVDDCGDPTAAAEGGHLGLFVFDELKTEEKKPTVKLNRLDNDKNEEMNKKWEVGSLLAAGQNIARRLMETPANIMTPTKFGAIAEELLKPLGVTVHVRDKRWAESMKMNTYLSVAKGSDEPPIFLEMHYNNAKDKKPVAFVGKGITFDSGGISLKPSLNMDAMRADMGGAANVLATIWTLAKLQAKVNIIGLTPLCENMPSGKASKPGDVVTAMNGKTVQIDNTDAEGRLILADALHYAHQFDPQMIVDIATLTGAMMIALGSSATGVFTTSTETFNLLEKVGQKTGDRVWRLPLYKHYTKQITEWPVADVNNLGKYPRIGGACIAAVFLKEFVTHSNWLHVDMAGVMENSDEVSYLSKGMSGRPLRTLVCFFKALFEKN